MNQRAAQLAHVEVAADVDAWRAAGFDMDRPWIGSTELRPIGAGDGALSDRGERDAGITSAGVVGAEELDGLSITNVGPRAVPDGVAHPNGVDAIDHLVVRTPDLDRTTAAFAAIGVQPRRTRRVENGDTSFLQRFFWLGHVICEVVGPEQPTGDGPATWWGLALVTRDLEATVELLGPNVSPIRQAVQPGRHVASVRSAANLGVPVLLITPHKG